MSKNSKVHFIPPKPLNRAKRVGIYCRISSNSVEQLKSLIDQVYVITRLTAATPQWLFINVYMDLLLVKQVLLAKSLILCLKIVSLTI